MPTLSSRPELLIDDNVEFTVDEIVEMIADAVSYVSPLSLEDLKLCLNVTCRTLWNTGAISDFFVHDGVFGSGFDVGFMLYGDTVYNVVQIN